MADCLLKLGLTEMPISLGLYYILVGGEVVEEGSDQLLYWREEVEGQVVALVAYTDSILIFPSQFCPAVRGLVANYLLLVLVALKPMSQVLCYMVVRGEGLGQLF